MLGIFYLFFEFFKTGLFTFGGGYASLPFLYEIAKNYSWFTVDELTRMIAISGLTPGPLGLNMATFSGFEAYGVSGAIVSSFALCLPMIVVSSLVFRLYKKFSQNDFVKSIMYILRPTSMALIAGVAFRLIYKLVLFPFNINALVLLFILFFLTFRLPRNPVYYMLIAGLWGVLVSVFAA